MYEYERPIVNCFPEPNYNLLKFLVITVKTTIGENNFALKDWWNFRSFIIDCTKQLFNCIF